MLFIIFVTGLIWLRSSWDKISGGKFVDNLPSTLTKFANGNPYPWYKSLLQMVAIPSSQAIAPLIMWTEFFVALSLTLVPLLLLLKRKNQLVVIFGILGGIGGMFLNGLFWLAAGWTSPSTDSLNLLMFALELIALLYFLKLLSSK